MLVRDPVYLQVADILRMMIQKGEVTAGSQFLSEREVAERYSVSRVTANKALSSLVSEGWLDSKKGIGNFVREGLSEIDLRKLESFTKQTKSSGQLPRTQLVKLETINSTPNLKEIFDNVQRFYSITRIRFVDDRPVILEERVIPVEVFPNLVASDLEGSLYALFEQGDVTITGAKEKITAVAASAEQGSYLGIIQGEPLLQIEGVGFSYGTPIWMEKTCYRSDHFHFINEIGWGFESKMKESL